MNPPPERYGYGKPRSAWRPFAIGLAVFATVSVTFVVMIVIAFAMSKGGMAGNK